MELLVHVDPSGSVTTVHVTEPPLPKIIQLETKWKGADMLRTACLRHILLTEVF